MPLKNQGARRVFDPGKVKIEFSVVSDCQTQFGRSARPLHCFRSAKFLTEGCQLPNAFHRMKKLFLAGRYQSWKISNFKILKKQVIKRVFPNMDTFGISKYIFT